MKARLGALPKLQQNQTDGAVLPVPHQLKPFGFQSKFRPGGDQLRQPFRAVHQKEVAAEFQRVGSRAHQLPGRAQVFPPGKGGVLACRAAGKIGRVGDAQIKSAGRKPLRYRPEVCAYTFHAEGKRVAANVLQSGKMGRFVDFQSGDGAAFILGAQEHPQRAAAGAEVENPGVFWQADERNQHHGIGA